MSGMRRREFITLLGGATAAWRVVARAQQGERIRRIGLLMNLAADDPEGQARIAAFHQGLQEWGWTIGRNVRIDVRWETGDADRIRRYAAELVALAPDVILASASAAWFEVKRVNRYQVSMPDDWVPLPQVAHEGDGYRLLIEVLPDPSRDVAGA